MDMYTFTNDQINATMNLAMLATIQALHNEGILTEEQAIAFRDTHVCLKVDKNNVWKWIRKTFNFKEEEEESTYYAVVFKATETKDE